MQYNTTQHDIPDMRPDDHRIVEGGGASLIAVSYEARPFGVRCRVRLGVLTVYDRPETC